MKIGVGDGYHDLVIDFEDGDTEQLKRIVIVHLKFAMDMFATKNKTYRGDAAPSLGPKGEFVEIYRKVGNLKTAIWDDIPELLTHETVEVVLADLLGHCLLTLDELAK